LRNFDARLGDSNIEVMGQDIVISARREGKVMLDYVEISAVFGEDGFDDLSLDDRLFLYESAIANWRPGRLKLAEILRSI